MFSIVITDKGGEQRKMNFTRNEVTIGRVQGNDIVLPKGNVSKHHSRIVLKDGRFIVVDIKSTNGTYVNGRKITSPLVVRPGDKVYIGDFILVIEEAQEAAEPAPSGAAASSPPPLPVRESAAPAPPAPPALPEAPPLPPAGAEAEPRKIIAEQPAVAPRGRRPMAQTLQDEPRRRTIEQSALGSAGLGLKGAASANVAPAPHPARPARTPDTGLYFLMSRLQHAYSLDSLSQSDDAQLQSTLAQTINAMLREGVLDDDIDKEALSEQAKREVQGLGALEPLLEDEQIEQIVVCGSDHIACLRDQSWQRVEERFSSAKAAQLALSRLLARAGQSAMGDAPVQHFDLPDGMHVTLLQAPLALHGPIIEVRRRGPLVGLQALVDDGMLNADMAALLERAITSGANVLVMGERGAGVTTLLAALAQFYDLGERLVSVEAHGALNLGHRPVVALGAGRSDQKDALDYAGAMTEALRFTPDRIVVDGVHGRHFCSVLEALSGQSGGNLVGMHATFAPNPIKTLRFVCRLRTGMEDAVAQELIAHTVALVVQVAKTEFGRKVLSITEVTGIKSGRIQSQALFGYEDDFDRIATSERFA
ncbi:MAG: ATPase, T2SS/T4P/T4SS family [Polyangiales bacterium]